MKTNNHGLRTTGRPTGNFGRPKCKGNPGELDLTKEILNRDNLRIPRQDEAFTRLQSAYNTTSDPKLKAFLAEQLAKRKATTTQPTVQPNERPAAPYWEMVSKVR
jgi:hypothetical protein